MKLKLLGTGAAEGIPAIYSDTRVSEVARNIGGREVRTRSGALIDGVLKIDFCPDILYHIHHHQLDARDWLGVVFTHSHDDHCCLTQLQYLVYPFNNETAFPFPLYGNHGVTSKVSSEYPDWPLEIHTTKAFCPFSVGDYTITPIKANHMLEEEAHNLIITHNGRSLLYGTDTGIWHEETWEFLANKPLDLVVLECTEGRNKTDYFGHLSVTEMLDVVERLRQIGTIHAKTTIATTHHSHNGDMTYAELVETLTPHGIIAGYDGLLLEA